MELELLGSHRVRVLKVGSRDRIEIYEGSGKEFGHASP